MTDIRKYLEEKGIDYKNFDHPAVFTCEDAQKLCPKMQGIATKNLFLRDGSGKQHFLAVTSHEKSVDIKRLQEVIGSSKLSFASPERLQKYLGVEPGAVTILGLVNDTRHEIQVLIDSEIWGKTLQCHPLVNTATMVISGEGMKKFLESSGNEYRIIDIPSRQS